MKPFLSSLGGNSGKEPADVYRWRSWAGVREDCFSFQARLCICGVKVGMLSFTLLFVVFCLFLCKLPHKMYQI